MTVEGRRVAFQALLRVLHLFHAFIDLFFNELAMDPPMEKEAHELLKVFPVEPEIEVFVWVLIYVLDHPFHLFLHLSLLFFVPFFDLGGQEPIIYVVLH